jgi:hypothetical protein
MVASIPTDNRAIRWRATRWASVTPLILTGFDDGKRAKAERLFQKRQLCKQGLPLEAIKTLVLRGEPLSGAARGTPAIIQCPLIFCDFA